MKDRTCRGDFQSPGSTIQEFAPAFSENETFFRAQAVHDPTSLCFISIRKRKGSKLLPKQKYCKNLQKYVLDIGKNVCLTRKNVVDKYMGTCIIVYIRTEKQLAPPGKEFSYA